MQLMRCMHPCSCKCMHPYVRQPLDEVQSADDSKRMLLSLGATYCGLPSLRAARAPPAYNTAEGRGLTPCRQSAVRNRGASALYGRTWDSSSLEAEYPVSSCRSGICSQVHSELHVWGSAICSRLRPCGSQILPLHELSKTTWSAAGVFSHLAQHDAELLLTETLHNLLYRCPISMGCAVSQEIAAVPERRRQLDVLLQSRYGACSQASL